MRMLELENLWFHVGDFALRDLTLKVDKGQYLCLVGPTGAGKTMLLECIVGIHRPTRGSIRVAGRDVTNLPPEARNIGYVPQDYALFPHLSTFENVAYGLRERGLRGAAVAQRVHEVARLLGIEHLLDRSTLHLSGGERQRTALARALVLGCELLLLDESLSALDVVTSRELARQIAELHRRLGLTIVHVTHDFEEAFLLGSHIAICDRGRLLQVGPLEEVFSRPKSRSVAEFLGIPNIFPRRGEAWASCPVARRLWPTSEQQPDGRCLCVRPDRVLVAREPEAGDWVSLAGVVTEVHRAGSLWEVTADVGRPFVATIGPQEQASLQLSPGDKVYLHVRKEAVCMLEDA